MKLILKPLDDSNDLVLVCDQHGTALGSLHVDAFLDGVSRGPIYDAIYRGDEVTVEVTLCTPTEK